MIKKIILATLTSIVLFVLFVSSVQILFYSVPYIKNFKTQNSVIKEILTFSWNDFIMNFIISIIIFLFIFVFSSILILTLNFFNLFEFKKTYWLIKCNSLLCATSALILSVVLSFNGEQFSLLATLFSSMVFLKPIFKNIHPDNSK